MRIAKTAIAGLVVAAAMAVGGQQAAAAGYERPAVVQEAEAHHGGGFWWLYYYAGGGMECRKLMGANHQSVQPPLIQCWPINGGFSAAQAAPTPQRGDIDLRPMQRALGMVR